MSLLSSCDVATWKAGRRRIASRRAGWLLNFFFLNSNDDLDVVVSTDQSWGTAVFSIPNKTVCILLRIKNKTKIIVACGR